LLGAFIHALLSCCTFTPARFSCFNFKFTFQHSLLNSCWQKCGFKSHICLSNVSFKTTSNRLQDKILSRADWAKVKGNLLKPGQYRLTELLGKVHCSQFPLNLPVSISTILAAATSWRVRLVIFYRQELVTLTHTFTPVTFI